MSGELFHTPAQIVRQLLIDEGLCSIPVDPESDTWPAYHGSQPDSPDDSLCIYTTEGRTHGRIMIDGETVEHEGIQVRIRANEEEVGRRKAKNIAFAFDGVLRETVEIEGFEYKVQSISRSGSIIPLGVEVGTSKRRLWTINALVAVRMTEVGTGT